MPAEGSLSGAYANCFASGTTAGFYTYNARSTSWEKHEQTEWFYATTNDNHILNVYLGTAALAHDPLFVAIGKNVAIINVNGDKLTDTLSADGITVDWLTSGVTGTSFSAKIESSGQMSGKVRLKIETLSAMPIMIKMLRRGYPILGYYLASS